MGCGCKDGDKSVRGWGVRVKGLGWGGESRGKRVEVEGESYLSGNGRLCHEDDMLKGHRHCLAFARVWLINIFPAI